MLKNKKIVYLVTQSKFGGAQKYILDLAKYFSQNNQVTIIVGEANNRDPQFFDGAAKIGVEIIVLKHLQRDIDLYQNIRSVFEIRHTLAKLKPNLLHINSSMAGLTGSLAALFYNMSPYNLILKVVYTAHGFVFNEPRSFAENKIFLFIEKFSSSLKSLIITVSDFDKQSGLKNKVAPEIKLQTIHIGINTESTNYLDKQTARQQLGLEREGFVIGSIASHYKTKGLEYLIEAAALMNNNQITFAVIGDGPETQTLQKLIQDRQLHNFKLLGQKDDAAKYLKAFDIATLSSLKEGLPYALLEAGLAGVPIVATKVGGIPEIISSDKFGILVEHMKPTALAEAFNKLFKNQELGSSLAKNNYNNVVERFSLSSMIRQTEAQYEKILPPI